MFIKNDEKGFTLVELMVATALIGILSVVASGQFFKFRNKSKQVEAKLMLAQIYTAEASFMAEKDKYTHCLRQIGFEPTGGRRYYAVGFMGVSYPIRPSDPTYINCNSTPLTPGMNINDSDVIFTATQVGPGGVFPVNDDFMDASVIDEAEFTAKAIGSLQDTQLDIWSINQDKVLLNEQSGI